MKRILGSLVALSVLAGTAVGASAAERPYTAQYGRYDDAHRGERYDYRARDDYRRGDYVQRDDWDHGRRIDYRVYRLPPPRDGYEWREVNGHYVEAAIVGGLIGAAIVAASH